MQIDNVRRGDAGTYMCTASNNVGTMSADEIDLRILCKPFLFFHGIVLIFEKNKTKKATSNSILFSLVTKVLIFWSMK